MSSASDSASELTDALAEVIRAALKDRSTAGLDPDSARRPARAFHLRATGRGRGHGGRDGAPARAGARRALRGGRSLRNLHRRGARAHRASAAQCRPLARRHARIARHAHRTAAARAGWRGQLARAGRRAGSRRLARRLPSPDDLLPGTEPESAERAGESRQVAERRAIGDRRALGERRLYDRRTAQEA